MAAGRPNVIDSHPDKLMILRELLQKKSHRSIAAKFGISVEAITRYVKKELRRYIVNGVNLVEQEKAVVQAESDKAARDVVMSDISVMRSHSHKLLNSIMAGMPKTGKLDCDPRGAASVMRELRGADELQARLEGRLDAPGAVHFNVSIGLMGAAAVAPAAPAEDWPGDTIDAEPVR